MTLAFALGSPSTRVAAPAFVICLGASPSFPKCGSRLYPPPALASEHRFANPATRRRNRRSLIGRKSNGAGILALRFGESARENRHDQHRAEQDEHRSLDELHPGRRDHAGRDDDEHHDDADDQHADACPYGSESEQRLHQRSGADHLRNQIEQADDQRADRGR